ncbi:MAG: triose-phosphate isomerase, partial [Dehalococcoidia bacterium]|nr:triose-phosphate isomerase [Dehalococcoidia bacterium]
MTAANRRPIIAGNWKMNTKPEEARTLAAVVRDQLPAVPGIDVILCPPFVSLALVAGEVDESPISVGAQNMYPEPSGAYTGEISPEML